MKTAFLIGAVVASVSLVLAVIVFVGMVVIFRGGVEDGR